jgi:mono/diheme cytochrome c family protein
LEGDEIKGQKLFNGTFGCAHCHGQDISSLADNRDLKRMKKRYGQGAGLVFDLVTKEGRNGTAMPPWSHVSREDLIDMKTFIFSTQIND